jgi:hypothetical protein
MPPALQFQPPTSTAGGAAAAGGAAGNLSAPRTVVPVRRPFKLPALRPAAPAPQPSLPESSAAGQQGEQAPTPLPAATQAAGMAADSSSTSSTGDPPACQLLLLLPEKPAPGAAAAATLPKIKLPGLRAKKKPAAVAVAAAGVTAPQAATSPSLDLRQPSGMCAAEAMPCPAADTVPAAAPLPPAAAPAVPAGAPGAAAAAPTGWRVQRLPAVLPEELPAPPQARCLPHGAQLLSESVMASDGCTALPLFEQKSHPAAQVGAGPSAHGPRPLHPPAYRSPAQPACAGGSTCAPGPPRAG